MRSDAVGPGSVYAVDRPGLVDATAKRVDTVAGSNRLLAGDHRRAHSRRPHRLTPPREPLRMAVARLRIGSRHSVTGNVLRSIRAGGGAGVAGSPSDHLPCPRAWRTGGAYPSTLAYAAVPHWAAAVASVASPSLDLYHGGCSTPVPGSLIRQPRPGRRGDLHHDLRRGVCDLHCDSPLCALDRGPLPSGGRSRAPTAEVVRIGRRPDRCRHRRAPAIPRRAAL